MTPAGRWGVGEFQTMRTSELSSERAGAATPVELSVVVLAGPLRGRTERVLSVLGEQTDEVALEVVVVDLYGESGAPLLLPEGLDVTTVPVPSSTSWGVARQRGIDVSRAPVVAFIEDHCVPQRCWARAVRDAFENDVAAVSYSFVNGSPDTFLFRSILVTEYGLWMGVEKSGFTDSLPANNLAYRKDTLVSELGPDLENALEVDSMIHEKLRSRGHRFWIAAGAVAAHQSSLRLSHLFHGHFSFARQLAARRVEAQCWGWLHRVAHAAAAPAAVPLLRLARFWRGTRGRPKVRRQVLTCLPLAWLLMTWAALGESLGCLFGAGRAHVSLATMELQWPRGENE